MGGGGIGLIGAPLYGRRIKLNIFKLRDIRCQYHPLKQSLNFRLFPISSYVIVLKKNVPKGAFWHSENFKIISRKPAANGTE
jgi:hypothetical protein